MATAQGRYFAGGSQALFDEGHDVALGPPFFGGLGQRIVSMAPCGVQGETEHEAQGHGQERLDESENHDGEHGDASNAKHPGHELAEKVGHGRHVRVDSTHEFAGRMITVESQIGVQGILDELMTEPVGHPPRQHR